MTEAMTNGYVVIAAALTDVGRVRDHNEDYLGYHIPSDPQQLQQLGALFIVCDGVGGGAAGEVASEHAVTRIITDYYQNNNSEQPRERLLAAIKRANSEIYEENERGGDERRMATTLVAALLLRQQVLLAHVGDSRAYVIRDGQVLTVTQDHSWVADMVRSGDLTEAEAAEHPWRNRITRSLGMSEKVDVEMQVVDIQPGDKLLLGSDGLIKNMSNTEICEAVTRAPAAEAVHQLVDLANNRGGSDNISVIVAEILSESEAKLRQAQAGAVPSPAAVPAAAATAVAAATKEPVKSSSHRKLWLIIPVAVFSVILVVAAAFAFNKYYLRPKVVARLTVSPTVTVMPTKTAPVIATTAAAVVTATAAPGTSEPAPTITITPAPTATLAPTITKRPPFATPTVRLTATVEATATTTVTVTATTPAEAAPTSQSGTAAPSPSPSAQVEAQVIALAGLNVREQPNSDSEPPIATLLINQIFIIDGYTKSTPDNCTSGLWVRRAEGGWACAHSTTIRVQGAEPSEELFQQLGLPQVTP